MPAIIFEYVRKAAEALVAANRTEDPEAGARLRQTAYDLLERARKREEALRRGSADQAGAGAIECGEPPPS